MTDYLTEARGISLSALMLAKYALANKVEAKIRIARCKAREQAYQASIFGRDSRVMLDFNNGFKFFNGMYDGVLCHQGNYLFARHFLSADKVPIIDGGEKGEEFACAVAIDSILSVKYWVRNVSKHENSFWLPTSTDKFYPDFVAVLNDDRILIVEYKGEGWVTNDDTKEKRMIGERWEKLSGGKGLFMIAEKTKDGLTAKEQIKKKIGVL
jgi:type III restriction enzyme